PMNDMAKPGAYNAYAGPHADLREFLTRVERSGELARISRAHWNLEMGTLAEIVNQHPAGSRAVLFDEIPDYPPGMRVLSGATNSMKRLAVTLGFPVPSHPLDVVRAYRDRMQTHRPIPPRVVARGPVLENVLRDGAV